MAAWPDDLFDFAFLPEMDGRPRFHPALFTSGLEAR